jgi:hypothetical protein
MRFKMWFETVEDIYHFSTEKSDKMIIDPKFFGKNSFSRNETKIPIKRSFFYLNPKDSEVFFTNKSLYKATVDRDKIYNLVKDPLDYKEKFVKNGVLDLSALLNKVSEDYIGVFYRIHDGTVEIVSLFVPVQAKKVN